MHIFIPSLGRADRKEGTLSRLPRRWLDRTALVCQAHEEEQYAELAEHFGVGLLVLPADIKRISPTRLFIGRYAESCDMEKICMIDDDIEFYHRPDVRDWKLKGADHKKVGEILDTLDLTLNSFAHCGISGREGNNRVEETWSENTRYMRLLAYRTEDYMACEHDRIDVMEDFDISLQMLRAGKPNRVFYMYAQGQKKTQDTGGCSEWRTLEVHNAGAERLHELHPNFVRLREKSNKTDREGFGTRKECTIYWKKSFASSQETTT